MLFIAHEAREKWRAKSPTGGRWYRRYQKGCISVVETLQRVSKSGEVCP